MRRPVEILFGARGIPDFPTSVTDPAQMSEEQFRTYDGHEPRKLLKEQMEEVLSSFKPRQLKVLKLRYGLVDGQTRTLKEVGVEIGRSISTVWRDERAALREMRAPTNKRLLKDYLE
ncbi:MAG: sigma factor-like helix-turn-helix DNA-binding protein [Candidatus Daviesbacteria bacterium]|nr:sigma factor-like helix-turn-helix DNA-binding protein [Candidatus Daviesbacteria bacterium]